MDYNHVFVRKKTASNVVKNDKNFKIRLSDLQKCCCIILYKPDGRILKFFVIFTSFDAVFFTNKYMIISHFLFTIPFAV